MIEKIDHIGIAVQDLESAITKYSALFGKGPDHREIVQEQKVAVAMFEAGESSVELLEGVGEDSPVSKFVRKQGEGIHHICYATPSLEEALAKSEKAGMTRIHQKSEIGAGGFRVAFLHPKTTGGVLIELVEK